MKYISMILIIHCALRASVHFDPLIERFFWLLFSLNNFALVFGMVVKQGQD